MIQTAEKYHFSFSKKGCACNGLPLIYTAANPAKHARYELYIWEKRQSWQLLANNVTIASGQKSESLNKTLKEIWD